MSTGLHVRWRLPVIATAFSPKEGVTVAEVASGTEGSLAQENDSNRFMYFLRKISERSSCYVPTYPLLTAVAA